MPVVASAIARPIHSPAIVTVVSFCPGDSGIMVMTALRMTAIVAVKTVVPIRSSIARSFQVQLHLSNPANSPAKPRHRSFQAAGGQHFQGSLAVGAQQLAGLGLRLRPIGKAATYGASALRGNGGDAGARILARPGRNPFLGFEQRQIARQRGALHAKETGKPAN